MMAREKIGPSGLTSRQIGELIRETGLKDEPLFSHREMVRRVIESLITKGVLRVVKKVIFSIVPGGGRYLTCSGCKVRIQESLWDELPVQDCCPGCGNEIQRF